MGADALHNSDDPAAEPGGRRWDLLLAVLLWTPLVGLYLWAMDRVPLQDGEYRTLYVIRESLPVLMEDRLRHAHQPLYFLAAWVSAKLLGTDSLWAMRALPQAASFIALGFLYATVRTIAGRYAAVLAVALCMLSGTYLWVGHNTRPAAFLALFVMAATYFIVSSGDRPARWRQVLIGGLALLALLSYNAAIPVVAIMLVGVLFVGPARWRLSAALLIALAVFLPWFLYTKSLYTVDDRLGWLSSGGLIRWPSAVFDYSFNLNLVPLARSGAFWAKPVVALIWVLHLGVVAFGLYRARRFGVLLGLMWFFPLVCGLFSLVVLDVNTMVIERYFTIAAMCQAVGLAVALTSLPWGGVWVRAALCVLVLGAAGVGMALELREPPPTYEMDFVDYIREEAPGADMVYIVQHTRLKLQIDYHLDNVQVYMMPQVFGVESNREATKYGNPPVEIGVPMSPMPHAGADELVVVEYRRELDLDPETARRPATQALRDSFDELVASYEDVEVVELPSGRVYHLRR